MKSLRFSRVRKHVKACCLLQTSVKKYSFLIQRKYSDVIDRRKEVGQGLHQAELHSIIQNAKHTNFIPKILPPEETSQHTKGVCGGGY